MSPRIAAETGIGAGAALFGPAEGSAALANVDYDALIATRSSRTDESEADRIGLKLAARAGYDPRAGVTQTRKRLNVRRRTDSPRLDHHTHITGTTIAGHRRMAGFRSRRPRALAEIR